MITESTQKFVVEGMRPLEGEMTVSGSKNAALPILCAALLSQKESILHNVPEIADIQTLLEIFGHLNVKTSFKKGTVTVDAKGLKVDRIPDALINRMRASVLLLGPLLSRFGRIDIPFPGGCVLGKRSVSAHTFAFAKMGVAVIDATQRLHLKVDKRRSAEIIMPEISVTGTENAVMFASLTPGITRIRLAAAEPHVQDLCRFLNKMGAKIGGIGTHFLEIEGVEELDGAEHAITGDYLEAGTFAVAALVTGGHVKIKGIATNQLDSFWQKLDEAGARYNLKEDSAEILPSKKLHAVESLRTAVYPSFPTDLQAPFAVLLTQAEGQSKIFETLFDGRLQYLFELEKMGAKVQVLNPHQAYITGPSRLKGVPISSLDLRAGAAMVLAALCAEGTTEISNIRYIDRGYENFEEKLKKLGARIKRV
jgi:UDP-N-acetylglucosamine 1-carboxyvinyltransferase